ncbi:hypothetical protein [Bacillus atrophaeus]|uniref:hypothetical protein n=1 Tax=Bacillus atrophaeus TaxID=1452 RepID=UPI00228094E2|nr:hypothetical protein [Bacillus atrophaeus]MCY7866094.1 hypothetical protein [Bacillus spizizenii]MCY8890342.1 hypothetical protein [Bacillus spizizenii]MEC0842066.1 hypothetical protein [Bacillus spizizenii]MED1125317.1 hypothetical protein [Bacillus atrophaeus]
MQLKYNNQVKNKVITIELETANFTSKENTALERFGEPVVKFEKMYEGRFPVAIEKRIKTGFKVRVKFDGTENIQAATLAANMFFEDIQLYLEEEMRTLMDKWADLETEFKSHKGFVDIKY